MPSRAVSAVLLAALLLVVPRGPHAAGADFAFAVVGDAPYGRAEALQFEAMLAGLAVEPLAFVVHVGDFKSGSSPCDDALFDERRAMLDASPYPLIYTPGDNEWTDCHRGGAHDPNERLARLRQLFFSQPESLGRRRMPVTRQSEVMQGGLPENLLWHHEGVTFATLHVVGSHNGLLPPVDRDFAAREAANLAWLGHALEQARAREARGLVLVMQADPQFQAPAGSPGRRGFEAVLGRLEQVLRDWKRPLLLIHGDGHRYRVDRPWPDLLRLETFGSPIVHWVRVRIDATQPGLFRLEPGPAAWRESP